MKNKILGFLVLFIVVSIVLRTGNFIISLFDNPDSRCKCSMSHSGGYYGGSSCYFNNYSLYDKNRLCHLLGSSTFFIEKHVDTIEKGDFCERCNMPWCLHYKKLWDD